MKYYDPKKCCQYCNLQFKNSKLLSRHEEVCGSKEIMEQVKSGKLKSIRPCSMLD